VRIGQTPFILFASKLISSALGFVATLFFARVLGAEVLGYYALVLVLAEWLNLGGEVGIRSAMIKRISEGTEESEYFTAGLITIAAFGVVVSVLLVSFRDLVNSYTGAAMAPYVILLVFVGLFSGIVGAALQGQRLVHLSGLLSPVQIGSRSVVQIALVLPGFGLSGMLVGYAAGGLVIGSIGIVFLSVG
jgi:O-antigen/teichoic acid export membrane protein